MTPLLLLPLLAAPAADVASQNWPGYRGDGSSCSAADLPITWGPTENVGWRAELSGYGQSSPVVWGGTVFVTAVEGKEKETLIAAAYDLATGKQKWRKEFPATQTGKNNPMMSRAAATPVADAAGVVCFWESGDLIALTPAGAVRWQRALTKDYGPFQNNHGLGSSLAQAADLAFALVDHGGPSYLLAVRKTDGKTAWKTERPSRTSWTSPTVARGTDGKAVVVVSGGGTLAGYDAATGDKTWELDGLSGNNIPSPAVSGDLAVVAAGENRMKPDPAAAASSNCAVRFGPKGAEVAWRSKSLVAGMSSPVIADGLVYLVDKSGIANCLDLKTGAVKYAERLPGSVWATPVVASGHVYFFGKDGVTVVAKAGPEWDAVSTNRLWSDADFEKRKAEALKKAAGDLGGYGGSGGGRGGATGGPAAAVGDVVYGVAVADGSILLRTGTELVCVRKGK